VNAHACQEVDGEETDEKGGSRAQDHGPEVHRSQVDPQEPGQEVHGPQVDRTQVDGSQVDPEERGSQVDRTQVDPQEPCPQVDSKKEHRQTAQVRRQAVADPFDRPMHPEGGRLPPFLHFSVNKPDFVSVDATTPWPNPTPGGSATASLRSSLLLPWTPVARCSYSPGPPGAMLPAPSRMDPSGLFA